VSRTKDHLEITKQMIKLYNRAGYLATLSEESALIFVQARNSSILQAIPETVALGRNLVDAWSWYDSYKALQSTPVKDKFLDSMKQKIGLLDYSPAQQKRAEELSQLASGQWTHGINIAMVAVPLVWNLASAIGNHMEAKRWDKGINTTSAIYFSMCRSLTLPSLRSSCGITTPLWGNLYLCFVGVPTIWKYHLLFCGGAKSSDSAARGHRPALFVRQ
jgi:hypothetical protein